MILHIPHSSTIGSENVPSDEVILHTDWHTDSLFYFEGSTKLVCGKSRFYCDVERLVDDPLNDVGQGIVYTKTSTGEIFREPSLSDIATVLSEYEEWHANLLTLAKSVPNVVIVDCHSFSEEAHDFEVPDICVGTNTYTDQALIDLVETSFKHLGYNVGVNSPFANAIHPCPEDRNVQSIMIEVNKRLYLDGVEKADGFDKLKDDITAVLGKVRQYELTFHVDNH